MFGRQPSSTGVALTFPIHQDAQSRRGDTAPTDPADATSLLDAAGARRTLAPASAGTINSMKAAPGSSTKELHPEAMPQSSTLRMLPTIRSVPSFEGASDASSESPSVATKNSTFSSSVNSNASAVSMASHRNGDSAPTVRLKQDLPPTRNPADDGDNTLRGGGDASLGSLGSGGLGAAPSRTVGSDGLTGEADGVNGSDGQSQAWDSTIGKAGLGKTGRVINKLVSDNESLKRDIQIERLRAEESKQAARLIEDKMERLVSDYESRLLEANVTKTLLSRKERQVETLNATVEQERRRTATAQEKERNWRDEMDKMRSSTTDQVEKANSVAAMMEGRYNVISSHWNQQGDEARKLRDEVSKLVEDRRRDDEKIATLRDLCDQQDGNIRALRAEKERILAMFDAYKREQESSLGDIKTQARRREEEQERLIEETREALHKLRWALNVKENVEGAQ